MRSLTVALVPALLLSGVSAVIFTGDAEARPHAAAAPEASERAAQVDPTSAPGEIRAGRSGAWSPAPPRTTVPAYAQVRSLLTEVTLSLPGAGKMELSPHSSVSTWGLTNVDADGGHPMAAFRVELRAGEVIVDVPRGKGARATLVSAGEAMLLVEPGSIARARLHADGAMGVAVYEGKARMGTQGTWRVLSSGSAAMLRPHAKVPAPYPLGPAPTWSQKDVGGNGPLALVFGAEETAPLAVRWIEGEGTTGYIAELARDEAFVDLVLRRELPASQSYLVTPPLPDGRYFARVRARGADGLPGHPSAPRALRVARVVLPPGGTHRPDGAISLPPDHQAKLSDPSGLEMRIGRVGFVNAPAAIGIPNDAPVSGFLRMSGDPYAVPVRLVPRAERAEIELTPRTAVWPADPIEIIAKLEGFGDSTKVEARFRVTVNMIEVPVDWWQRGKVWKGRIAPKRGEGPWVVRVEAKDEAGTDLGRAHLEVISGTKGHVASR